MRFLPTPVFTDAVWATAATHQMMWIDLEGVDQDLYEDG